MQAKENREAISSLSSRVDALQKSMDTVSGLSDKVTALDSKMSELLTWKTHTEDRLQQWKHGSMWLPQPSLKPSQHPGLMLLSPPGSLTLNKKLTPPSQKVPLMIS